MAVADVGWGMLFARNTREVMDLALISRRAAEDSKTPFMCIQDGFLTTHTVQNVMAIEPEMMKLYVGKAEDKIINLMDTANPVMSGVVQNQDSYMKGKVAQRYFYDAVPDILGEAMIEFVLVGMGSMMETAMVAVDHLRKNEGIKAGVLHVTSFRPFPGAELVGALKDAQAIAVIERMDNPLGQSNPLTMEVKSAFADAATSAEGYPEISSIPTIYSGIAGLGSRDVRGGDFIATVKNMASDGKKLFALGIDHPLAIDREEDPEERTPGEFAMRGHSVGGYGSVTTNKVIATLLANLGLQVQAYPKYGSEKKGLPTTYYLTAANEHIRTHSELERVDFVPLNDVNAFNAVRIAREEAPTPDLEQRFQGIVLLGIFLRHTPFQSDLDLSDDELFVKVEEAVRKYWGRKGEDVVESNLKAIRRGFDEVFEISRDLIESTIGQETDGQAAGAVSVGC